MQIMTNTKILLKKKQYQGKSCVQMWGNNSTDF